MVGSGHAQQHYFGGAIMVLFSIVQNGGHDVEVGRHSCSGVMCLLGSGDIGCNSEWCVYLATKLSYG